MDGDGTTTSAEWDAYAERWALDIRRQIAIDVNGRTVPLALKRFIWKLVPGAADLFTLRLEARYRVSDAVSPMTLAYSDTNRPQDLGWKEIWINAAPGVTLVHSSVATIDRSQRLTDFSSVAGGDLPNELTARADVLIVPSATSSLGHSSVDKSVRSAIPTGRARRFLRAPAQFGTRCWRQTQVHAADGDQRFPREHSELTGRILGGLAKGTTGNLVRGRFPSRCQPHATGWDHLVFLLGLLC